MLFAESPTYDVPRPHPPEAGHTHTPPTSTTIGTVAHGNSVDDEARLLELLGNEDDDEDDELLAALSSSPGNGTGHTHSTTLSTDDGMYMYICKVCRLRWVCRLLDSHVMKWEAFPKLSFGA